MYGASSARFESFTVPPHLSSPGTGLRTRQRRPVPQPEVERFREDAVQRQEVVMARLRSVIGEGNPADRPVKRLVGRFEPGRGYSAANLRGSSWIWAGRVPAGPGSALLSSFPCALPFLTPP